MLSMVHPSIQRLVLGTTDNFLYAQQVNPVVFVSPSKAHSRSEQKTKRDIFQYEEALHMSYHLKYFKQLHGVNN